MEPAVEPPAQCPLDGAGLLVDLLAHEVGVALGVIRGQLGVDDGRLLGGGAGIEGGGAETVGAHRGHLTVVEMHHLAGVTDQRGNVRGDEHLLVTDAEHDRAPVAGGHDLVAVAGIENHHAVGADNRGQRLADRLFQVVGRACRDQMGKDLAVGLGGEHGSARGQLGA